MLQLYQLVHWISAGETRCGQHRRGRSFKWHAVQMHEGCAPHDDLWWTGCFDGWSMGGCETNLLPHPGTPLRYSS
ncbi:hypothetical protein VTK73DRAFT_910 [Phialemonium thermophilum]|uniref:Uncharacterized protein n=1 Tax=Phialemonium thermophilum TaxID=223376 RepID=A0ABR3Y4B9_9PEZI